MVFTFHISLMISKHHGEIWLRSHFRESDLFLYLLKSRDKQGGGWKIYKGGTWYYEYRPSGVGARTDGTKYQTRQNPLFIVESRLFAITALPPSSSFYCGPNWGDFTNTRTVLLFGVPNFFYFVFLVTTLGFEPTPSVETRTTIYKKECLLVGSPRNALSNFAFFFFFSTLSLLSQIQPFYFRFPSF